MDLLIVTGMSGAGKSQAANALEDMGYYCVDNIPPTIIPALVNLSSREGNTLKKVAIVTDIRGGDMFADLKDILSQLKKQEIEYKIIFIDADDNVLVRRYKENRRKHPLSEGMVSISDAVREERNRLREIRAVSDYVVDTTYISISQLKEKLSDIFGMGVNKSLNIQCKSFGFKYGADTEADLVIDVRCLPNPFYVEELKNKTGLEKQVRDYVLSTDESRQFFDKLAEFIDCAVPLYSKEGKSQLVIAFGCTGGKHRSVTFAQLMCKRLTEKNYNCKAIHRDIHK
ncbi:MAG: RNase adapter RapZ [Clostridia bacterium]|nr:RNase adapter RapZ [Clostridia bacterium]